MKNTLYIILWYILTAEITLADWWILWNFKWDKTETALRNWDIHIDDIPTIIKWAIDFALGIAWTIAVIAIIIWAYQVMFWSFQWDRTKWRNTIIMALSWLAIASLAWFIIKFLIDNLA